MRRVEYFTRNSARHPDNTYITLVLKSLILSPFPMTAERSRISFMKSRSQEILLFATCCLAIFVGTMGSAYADPFGDIDAMDKKTSEIDPSGDDSQQRRDDRKREDEERIRRDVRRKLDDKEEEKELKARQMRSLYDKFDGSEFQKKTFIDTDFRKQSFVDLSARKKTDGRPDDDGVRTKDLFSVDDDKREDDYYARRKARRDLREKERDIKMWRHLMRPIPVLDWVPSAPDPIHMGAFEREPDNGTPVPYHLNGHPNFERGLPWKN